MKTFLFADSRGVNVASRNISESEKFQVGGFNIFLFDRLVYFDRKDGKIHFKNLTIDNCNPMPFRVFGEFQGYLRDLCFFGNKTPSEIKAWLEERIDRLQEFNQETKELVADIPAYDQKLKEEKRKRDEQRELDRKNRELKEKEREEKAFEESLEKYKRGEFVRFSDFEDLCKKFKIEIAPRTLGSARKRVIGVKKDTVKFSGKKPLELSWAIFELNKTLGI